MKHTPSLMTADLLTAKNDETAVTECMNLRPDSAEGLTPVDNPLIICTGGRLKPFYTHTDTAGRTHLFLFDTASLAVTLIDPQNDRSELGALPSEPLSVAAMDNGMLTVYTAKGNTLLYPVGGTWAMTSGMPDTGDVLLRCHHAGTFTASIPAMTLKGDYQRCQGTLTSDDTRTFSAALLDAYTAMARQAAATGACFQPRLMAWRMTDAYGNTLAASVPVLVNTPDTAFTAVDMLQCTVTNTAGNFCQTTEMTLRANAYRLTLELPAFNTAKPVRRWVRYLEVLATPPLHPVDYSAVADTRLVPDNSAQGTLNAYMPGTSVDMMPSAEPRREMIIKALCRFHDMAQVIYTITDPLSGEQPRSVSIPLNDNTMPAAIAAANSKALNRPVIPADPRKELLRRCTPPNSFIATTVAESGDTTILADITPVRFSGHLPALYAVSTVQSDGFRQLTKTVFDGSGEVTVAHSQYNNESQAPATFSPLLVSPHPEATAMTLRVATSDGSIRSRSFALQRSPCGRYSYFLAPSLTPQQLTDTDDAYVIPATVTADNRQPGTLMAARAGTPYAPLGQCRMNCGQIQRVTRQAGSAGAWDYARQHLTVWATGGIHSMSVNSANDTLGATLLHPTGVTRHDAVAVTPNGIYAALADGTVCRLNSSHLTPIMRSGSASAIGYEPRLHELWAITPDGTCTKVIPLAGDKVSGYYTRNHQEISELFSAGHSLLALTVDGTILDLSSPLSPPRPVKVSYSARRPSALRPGTRWTAAWWMLQSAGADIDLTLSMDSGAGQAGQYLLTSLHLHGQVNAPVRARLAARALPYISCQATGTLAPGSTLGPITLESN